MKTITQRMRGRLIEENGRYALLLLDPQPPKNSPDLLYLRYAFVTQGGEELLFPAFILDDWGSEIKSLKLYDWFNGFAPQFPRAELFGLDAAGREMQRFVRQLELYSKLPCYAYPGPNTPLADGALVEAILLPDKSLQEPVRIKRPSDLKRPLRAARVSWWQVNPTIASFPFS